MTSLQNQIALLTKQLEALCDDIPADEDTIGVTIEHHRPGNGKAYPRLRAAKGKTLANGKRTMSLSDEEKAEWEQRIYARQQHEKAAQCLAFLKQTAKAAQSITWPSSKTTKTTLVNDKKSDTKRATKAKRAKKKIPQPKVRISYVLKDAKTATPMNRTVHAITEAEPESGRWYTPALCGAKPKAGSWGWRLCDSSELSCPKCYAKVQQLS